MSSVNVLGEFYRQLPMERKDNFFWRVLPEETVVRQNVYYPEIVLGRQIY